MICEVTNWIGQKWSSRSETRIFQDNKVNTAVTDALAPCVSRHWSSLKLYYQTTMSSELSLVKVYHCILAKNEIRCKLPPAFSNHSRLMTTYGDIIWVSIDSGNGLLPDGFKPSPELMLTKYQWGLLAFTWGHIHRKFLRYLSDMSWKFLIKNYCHISPRGQWVKTPCN